MNTVYTEHRLEQSFTSRAVFLIFLCEFFLITFVSTGTRSQFDYSYNNTKTGTRVCLPLTALLAAYSLAAGLDLTAGRLFQGLFHAYPSHTNYCIQYL